MRYRRTALLVALVAGSLVASAGFGPSEPVADEAPPTDRLVQPGDGDGALWPYTSRQRGAAGRTLAINVVVFGEADRVRRVLAERSDQNWSAADPDAPVPASPWGATSGATRYTYVAPSPGEQGRWVDAEYQLGVGSYFARRTHVRAYPSPYGNWTALQTHTEYWDWFRLRHTVTGLESGAVFLERDLRDLPVTAELRREYHGVGGSGDSGWLSIVEFAPAAVVAGALAGSRGVRSRSGVDDLLLPAALVGIVIGVRAGGIAAGELAGTLNPKVLSAGLYPVLALGPLVAVSLLARDCDPTRAALLAGGGFGAGLVLDLWFVGIETVPVRLALQRVALVSALALVALGTARDERRIAALGAAAWALALASPLLGVP